MPGVHVYINIQSTQWILAALDMQPTFSPHVYVHAVVINKIQTILKPYSVSSNFLSLCGFSNDIKNTTSGLFYDLPTPN